MMKLTIEHLAPYLPYGLKMHHIKKTYPRFAGDVIMTPTVLCNVEYYLAEQSKSSYKPYLRPLSQLTQEIEHNGERFVPIVELLKLKYPKADKEGRYSTIDFDGEGYPKAWYRLHAMWEIILFPEFENYPLWIIKKLNEWHFDYMKLIEQVLALPIQ